MPIFTLTFLAFFQVPPPPATLRDGCSTYDQELTVIRPSDQVEVNHAVSGGDVQRLRVRDLHGAVVLSDDFNGPWVQIDGNARVLDMPEALEPLAVVVPVLPLLS